MERFIDPLIEFEELDIYFSVDDYISDVDDYISQNKGHDENE
jgi:hypothetical protein